jgi:integrase
MVDGANGTTVPLVAKPMRDVTKADVEAVRASRRAALVAGQEAVVTLAADAAKPERERLSADERKRLTALATAAKRADKGGAVSTNRLLAVFRRVCSWAVAEGYIASSPFKRGGETIVKLDTAVEYARSRRLTGDEDTRLLAAASPHLRACIECALSTGMRVGEILNLRWADVRCDVTGTPRELVLPATTTKTGRTRVLPVGARLRAVLEMLRLDAAGQPHRPTAYVFGHVETGERIGSVKTAWVATCRRAGISGLRFHDLRRSFACSLLESGAGLHDVRDFLGHTDITTTSKYLAATPVRLRAALDRMEGTTETPPDPASVPPVQPPVPTSALVN